MMTMTFYDVILYFRLFSGRKSRKSELLCFSSDLYEVWYAEQFWDANYKRKTQIEIRKRSEQKIAIFYRF